MKGKRVLVAGAASGIGAAPAVMAREVADLLVSGRNDEVRLKLSEKKPAFTREAPELDYD